jgi:hypothetical protein
MTSSVNLVPHPPESRLAMRNVRLLPAVLVALAVLAPGSARGQSAAPNAPSLDQLALPPSNRFT